MKIKSIISMLVMVAAVTSLGAVPTFYDDFETNLYVQGVPLATNSWQASGAAAYVTNNGGVSGRAAVLGEIVALTNSQTASANIKVWTDFQVKPVLGVESPDLPTNTASFLFYFDSNGVFQVETAAGWQPCTNDIWGNSISPATNNGYVRLSLFQDYSTSTQAVFLDGRLILQDLRFTGTAPNFNRLVIQNTESNAWLDNVWIKTNFDSATLTHNYNGDTLADAQEVNDYGYARRTFYVSKSVVTNLTPLYTSLTNAMAVCRARDVIHIIAGNYSGESLAMAANQSNVVFEGDAFTVNSLTVVSGASASFAQTVTCGTLSVTGQVTMGTGASLDSSSAYVGGSLTVSTNGTFVATNLTLGASGILTLTTNATLVAVATGVTATGPFTVSNNVWGSGTLATMPLPFSDNFDAYSEGIPLALLKLMGWNATDGTVKVQSSVANSGKAVVLPDGAYITNSITTAATTNIWTDFFIQPVLGVEPWVPATNTSSFIAYVNTNGYLVVATAGGGWHVCSNKLDSVNSLATPLQSNAFKRVTLCQNLSYNPPQFAVFVDGAVVAQGLSSPASITHYNAFGADNRDGTAYLDDVMITTNIPASLTNGPMSDLDLDGVPDAVEIAQKGSIYDLPMMTAASVTAIGTNGATLVVSVTNNGGPAVTSEGSVWGTTANPVVNPSASLVMAGMSPGQHTYARGWASNVVGIAYSIPAEFYTEPMQATALTGTAVTAGFTISWTADASSTGTLVLVRQDGAVDAAPVDGSNYTANAFFGSGGSLGNSNYVVYAGSGTNVTVNNLVYGTTYQVAAFAYAGSDTLIQYRTNNAPTCTLIWPPRGSVYLLR